MDYKRNRLIYGIVTLIVMFLGLCSRKLKYFIPDFLNVYLGDALWALMILCCVDLFSKLQKQK